MAPRNGGACWRYCHAVLLCQHQPSLLCEAISPGHEREIRFDSSLAVHLHSPLNLTRRDDACQSRPAVRPLTRRTLLSPAVYHRNCLGIQKKN